MSSRLSDHMIHAFTETLDEAETLEIAVWGHVPNIKSQPILDRRKETLTQDIDKLIRFLQQRKQAISELRMDEGDNGNE